MSLNCVWHWRALPAMFPSPSQCSWQRLVQSSTPPSPHFLSRKTQPCRHRRHQAKVESWREAARRGDREGLRGRLAGDHIRSFPPRGSAARREPDLGYIKGSPSSSPPRGSIQCEPLVRRSAGPPLARPNSEPRAEAPGERLAAQSAARSPPLSPLSLSSLACPQREEV